MFEVLKGIQKKPLKCLLYGVAGIGKTTLATHKKDSLLIDIEEGSNQIDCERIKVTNWQELMKAIEWLSKEPKYTTVIFDSYTAIEKLATAHICQTYGWDNLEKPGFGKGYEVLKTYAQKYLSGLDFLVKNGMNSITVAHVKIKSVIDPMNETYDRFEPDMHKNSVTLFCSVMDCIFFYKWKHFVKETEKGDRFIARANGERELYTSERSAFLAKSRIAIDALISNPKEDFFDGIF